MTRFFIGCSPSMAGNIINPDFPAAGVMVSVNQLRKRKSDFDVPDGHKYIVIVLTIAHLDYNPTNNEAGNLAALCQRCHNRHDTKDRQRNRKKLLTKDQL